MIDYGYKIEGKKRLKIFANTLNLANIYSLYADYCWGIEWLDYKLKAFEL